ncbi:hypothetical protein GCM10011335_41940 [Aureimonas glaciei]|uniref:Uncharacterized protein n=1 Tax=Aureimonas glaciei TaxID=1776957 RepID=A0A917DFR3_9HYPH|nr:hypothetical protein GCM10011335_41940 [Aureimonas glaciei]
MHCPGSSPFVEVAKGNGRKPRVFDLSGKGDCLRRALPREHAKVRREDAGRSIRGHACRFDHAAAFKSSAGEKAELDVLQRPATPQEVSVVAATTPNETSFSDMSAEPGSKVLEGVGAPSEVSPSVDFLKRDDVALRNCQLGEYPFRIAAPVAADAAVNVPSHEAHG